MKYEHWLDDPAHVKWLWRGFLVLLALTVVAGALVDLHPHFEIERWFGFYAAYGFATCLLMIVVAKALGLLLKRTDTYYAEQDGANGEPEDGAGNENAIGHAQVPGGKP